MSDLIRLIPFKAKIVKTKHSIYDNWDEYWHIGETWLVVGYGQYGYLLIKDGERPVWFGDFDKDGDYKMEVIGAL